MRKIPAVKAMVMVIGNPSGMAEAVKATEVVIISVNRVPLKNPVQTQQLQLQCPFHKLFAYRGHLILKRC